MNDKELMIKLREVFIQEAKERLNSMSTNLITLEQGATPSEQTSLFEEVYRDAHSLKGASRSIGLASIESVFQIVEDIFNEVKDGQFKLTPALFDILQNFIKILNEIIDSSNMESPESVQQLKKQEEVFLDYLRNKDGDTSGKDGDTSGKDGAMDLVNEVAESFLDNDDEIDPLKSEPDTSDTPVETDAAVSRDEIIKDENKEMQSSGELLSNIEKDKIVDIPEKNGIKDTTEENKSEDSTEEEASEEVEEIPNNQTKTAASSAQDTVRISSGKLDSLLLKSENMIRIKQVFYEHIPLLQNTLSLLEESKQLSGSLTSDCLNIKKELADTEGQDRRNSRQSLEKIIEFIDESNSNNKSLESILKNLLNIEKENMRNTEKIVDGFLYDVKEIAMLPFSNILYAFPLMVRDISKQLGKNIKFTMKGEEIKLDRRILQEIKDPLVHLIRNSIDHGIEDKSDRKKAGKNETGFVELNISQKDGNKILIVIRDDGKGINVDTIKNGIVDNNLLSLNEASLLTDTQILGYIFHSGFSTKKIITDLSGRGLGLAIVKGKIESLGGVVLVDSKEGKYSEIQITLPVTLATFKGVLVEADKRTFVIPSNNLEEAIRLKHEHVRSVENKKTINYNKATYPLINLSSVLGFNRTFEAEHNERAFVTAAIIATSNELMALEVDEIIEEQEILIKDLGSQLKKVNNLTGATILNSGKIVPILNIQDLFKSATNITTAPPRREQKTADDHKKVISSDKKTMLVVEDSITSRILLKNILESAGYNTETAVDGLDGLTFLKSNKVDLVISDIEMPRMDGFTLTSQIRAEQKLKHLPVILVTSRSSLADKERGAEVGADAYIVKSEFDQTTLIETIKTLL